MIFRSEKKLKLGLLKIGEEGFTGLYSKENEKYIGNVLVIREATKDEYLAWIREEGHDEEHALSNEYFYKYYYEIHID